MNFWSRVTEELSFQGFTQKELAQRVGISPSLIVKGTHLNSSPSADTAVKIAKVLNVSVEYLVTGQDSTFKEENIDFQKYREYSSLIAQIDSLPEKQKELVKSIISKMSEW